MHSYCDHFHFRRWRRLLLLGLFLLSVGVAESQVVIGQAPGELNGLKPRKHWHRWKGPKFAEQERSLGLVPGLTGGIDVGLGLGVARGWWNRGEGGGNGTGMTLGVETYVRSPRRTAFAEIWHLRYGYFLGWTAGFRAERMSMGGYGHWTLRPEIGLALHKFRLTYGYNYHFYYIRDFFPVHTARFTYYWTILPKRRKLINYDD